jgi:imidazolonepropionase-like amidohydrolase
VVTTILCGNLITGHPPGTGPARDGEPATITVRDGVIERIEPGHAAPGGEASVVDYGGYSVAPGLIDLHEHLNGNDVYAFSDGSVEPSDATWALVFARQARRVLARGVTTVRIVGAPNHVDIDFRRGVAEGLVTGPRMVCSGQALTMTGGHGWFMGVEVDGPNEAARAARSQIKVGADWIKLMASGGVGVTREGEEPTQPQMTVDEMRAAVDVAHFAGIKATAHADGIPGIRNALEAGVDCIEHGIFMGDDEAAHMARHGIVLVPTLSTMHGIAYKAEEFGHPRTWVPIALSTLEPHAESLRAAIRAGVTIGAGTDGFGDIVDEITMIRDAGLSTWDALGTAMWGAADILGMKRIGRLEPGCAADWIALTGDPRDDLEALRAPAAVSFGGSIWHQPGHADVFFR